MIALDTNVLIYACDKSDPARQQTALDLVANTTDGVMLWQVACEFVAASRKLERQGFTAADAWARLGEFMSLFPLELSKGASTLERAKSLHLVHHVSFWDAMILSSCVDAGVARFYSEDLPGGAIADVQVINPFK